MATYQQRGGAWRAQVRMRGARLSATFDTFEQARAWATAEEAKLEAGAKVVAGRVAFLTVADLFRRYEEQVSPNRRGERWEVIRLQMLARDKAFAKPLRDFGPDDVAAWRDARLKVVAASSVNRELNVVSAVFRVAIREWKLGLRENPVHLIARPRNPPPRKRRISDAEVAAIRVKLGWSGEAPPATSAQWVAWAHALALETAMRKGELLGLRWAHVRLARRHVVLLDGATKSGEGRAVPLSRRAMSLFHMLESGEPEEPVIPIASGHFDKLFREAKAAAGLADLHFHDTRREATTRIAPKVKLLDLAKITGHRDLRTLERVYYSPDPEDLADKLD